MNTVEMSQEKYDELIRRFDVLEELITKQGTPAKVKKNKRPRRITKYNAFVGIMHSEATRIHLSELDKHNFDEMTEEEANRIRSDKTNHILSIVSKMWKKHKTTVEADIADNRNHARRIQDIEDKISSRIEDNFRKRNREYNLRNGIDVEDNELVNNGNPPIEDAEHGDSTDEDTFEPEVAQPVKRRRRAANRKPRRR